MELLTYRKFNDDGTASEIGALLKEQGIFYEIEDTNTFFSPEFSYNKANFNILLKLKGEDFEKANSVLEEYYHSFIDKLDKDYYLFYFSNDELLEILQKPDEWGELDVLLAKKLLKERGSVITDNDIQYLKNQRIETLAKPQKAGIGLIIFGYFSTLLNLLTVFSPLAKETYNVYSVMPFLGAAFVIWNLIYFKKTLPNGKQVYVYEESSHKHAFFMIALLLIGLIKIFLQLIF